MDSLLFPGGKFLGIEWHLWKFIGWLGAVVFFSRFIVQWYATEKRKQVVVPQAFWWLSLIGSLMLLSYAFYRKDSVFIISNLFAWVPYIRNLIIHRRHKGAQITCPTCESNCPPQANFCANCGAPLKVVEAGDPGAAQVG